MPNAEFYFDRNRQERMVAQIDAIIGRRGNEDGLRSRQDVLFRAVQELWQRTFAEPQTLGGQPESAPDLIECK